MDKEAMGLFGSVAFFGKTAFQRKSEIEKGTKMPKLPRVGKRIVKSAVGVVLCYLIQYLRGGSGIVFYSQLAVLWCIQPYIKDSFRNGLQRITGTFIGAAYGLAVILTSRYILPGVFSHEICYDLLVGCSTVLVLYTTVVTNHKNASYFSAVVFLSIVVNHIGDTNPLLFVGNRCLDTIIGIALGVGINMFRIPRRKNKDILFISGVDETILNREEKVSPFTRIELNRMLDDGANFTVSTMRTPASIIDALDGIHWRLPLIVMDGAALFDMNERKFLKTSPLRPEHANGIKQFFRERDANCFINVVIEGMLVICFQDTMNPTEKQLYEKMRRSPYRNYVKKDLSEGGEVLYFMTIGESGEMAKLCEALASLPFYSELKILRYPAARYPGNDFVKIYDKRATKDNMIAYLKEITGLQKTLTFGSIEGKYDVLIRSGQEDVVAHTLERVYEPTIFAANFK